MKPYVLKVINIIFCLISYFFVFFVYIGINFKSVSCLISLIPGNSGIYIRKYYYNRTLKKVGDDLKVGFLSYFVYRNVSVGDRCYIEENVVISLCDIADDVVVASKASLMSGAHHHDVDDLEKTFLYTRPNSKRIFIGSNCWIGTHSIIMNDIGNDVVIGAGSVVTKKIEDLSVAYGVPAKKIRVRGKQEK
ncbi:DapH/DapD/GlmU-related protein [Photobacterium damselae subsp. damselae]|uniref:acyltransferase n=1 Tax=Photobacterium damselae TaxID=38293 RepID=UPI00311AC88E